MTVTSPTSGMQIFLHRQIAADAEHIKQEHSTLIFITWCLPVDVCYELVGNAWLSLVLWPLFPQERNADTGAQQVALHS